MKKFRLIESIWIGCNMSGADYWAAYTDEEFDKFSGYASDDESNDVTVRELVCFEVGDEPPPMVGSYYALYTDEANCMHCIPCKTVADLEEVRSWHEKKADLYYATEDVL